MCQASSHRDALATRNGVEQPAEVTTGGALGVEPDGAGGVVIRALELWLDPPGARPSAFVSHAHASGGLESTRVLCSPETLRLAAAGGSASDARVIAWDGSVEMAVGAAFGGGTARLSIAPAGHLLGAAQLVVDHPRGRFVYTGDWSGWADASHPAGAVVACDELAVTATFALPIFRFPPPETALGALVAWCREELQSNATPIVLAQTPGGAQAVLLSLVEQGIPVAARDDVLRACAAYEAPGRSFAAVRALAEGDGGAAVVASSRTKRSDLHVKGRMAVAYASGWSLLDAMVDQRRADAAFPLADHADSDALVSLALATGARLVHAIYGDARALADLLRRRGLEAVRAHDAPGIDERSGA